MVYEGEPFFGHDRIDVLVMLSKAVAGLHLHPK
jgi:hypothetical protein